MFLLIAGIIFSFSNGTDSLSFFGEYFEIPVCTHMSVSVISKSEESLQTQFQFSSHAQLQKYS